MICRLAPLLFCLACAGSGNRLTALATPADRTAILAAANQLFDAMRNRDTVAIRRVLHERAALYAVRSETGRMSVMTAEEFVSSIARADRRLDERMFDPRVEAAGDIASVWTFYDFHRGDEFSHCGTDAMHLVREGSEWKVVAITYTVQTTSCPSVR